MSVPNKDQETTVGRTMLEIGKMIKKDFDRKNINLIKSFDRLKSF